MDEMRCNFLHAAGMLNAVKIRKIKFEENVICCFFARIMNRYEIFIYLVTHNLHLTQHNTLSSRVTHDLHLHNYYQNYHHSHQMIVQHFLTLWNVDLRYFCIDQFHYCDVIMGAMASQITSLTVVYSTVYSGADQRKHQSSASLAFVRGIHRGPVNSPHKWPVTRKMFPFDDVIMDTEQYLFQWLYLNLTFI